MEIAILGAQQSGKSTLFKIMTSVDSASQFKEVCVKGVAKIPDDRFSRLVEIFKPKKEVPAAIPFIDLNVKGENAWNTIRKHIGGVDAILHIVDFFSHSDLKEAVKEYQNLVDEMIISDLVMIENKLEKLQKMGGNVLGVDDKIQKELFPKLKDCLESGKSLRTMEINEQQMISIRGYCFLSLKPELIVLNTSENADSALEDFKKEIPTGSDVVSICAQVESEIAELSEDERKEFLESLGIKTPAFEKIIRSAFSLLGRIYFFTVGEDEVRAWIIEKGVKAPKAAGTIHKDFERGFIKAEIVGYEEFIAAGADMAKSKSAGQLRLEGKEYVVKDGDIINFRFNV